MRSAPRVSVVLTSCNHAQYVAESIRSVLEQGFSDLELIVIDDCSDDRSVEVIRSFDDVRIRLIQNPARSRAARGINLAIAQEAAGEYVALLHSDDAFLPAKLEKQVDYLDRHPEIGAAFALPDLVDERGRPFLDSNHHYWTAFEQPNRSRWEWLGHFFRRGNGLCHPSAVVRRSCYETVGLYDRRFGQLIDLDLWIRLCLKYEIHVIQERLVLLRVPSDASNTSGNTAAANRRLRAEWQVILRSYLAVETLEDLKRVFPDLSIQGSSHRPCLPFLVAIYAVRTGDPIHQAFGMGALFDLLRDERTAALIAEQHDFGYLDLIQLAGEVDLYQVESLDRCQRELTALENETPPSPGRSWSEVRRLEATVSLLENGAERTSGWRGWLRLSRDLRTVPFLPYRIESGQPGLSGITLVPVIARGGLEGRIGVELVSNRNEIVGQTVTPLSRVRSYQPLHLPIGPVAGRGPFQVRVFVRDTSRCVQVIERGSIPAVRGLQRWSPRLVCTLHYEQ